MTRSSRWSWIVVLPLTFVISAVVVSLVYLRRDFLHEVEVDAPWPLRVAAAELRTRQAQWKRDAQTTATLLAAVPGAALDPMSADAILTTRASTGVTRRLSSDSGSGTDGSIGSTVRCGVQFCLEIRSRVPRSGARSATLITSVPLSDSAFAFLDVRGPSTGSRVSILFRHRDSVFVLGTAAHDSVPLTARAFAWNALPAHIREAFSFRERTGHAPRGLVRAGVVYATFHDQELDWLLLREVDVEGLIERLLGPLALQFLIVTILLLLAFGYTKARRREFAMLRERELTEVRADFVAAVSHELRTPLAQIKLFAELLRSGSFKEPQEHARAVHIIEKEASRLSILVDNVLSHARLRRTRAERQSYAATATTAVERDIAQVIEAFAPLADDRGVSVVASHPDSVTIACVESQALRQILLNLVENAVKYGPRGQTITIDVAVTERTVTVSVSDQGPGVPLDERDMIWSAFSRGRAARGSTAGGSGIGLSVVHDLVAQYGGSVHVSDANSGGARFEVSFRRQQ